MNNFQGSLGQRRSEGNLLVELCSHKFFLKHALQGSIKSVRNKGVFRRESEVVHPCVLSMFLITIMVSKGL